MTDFQNIRREVRNDGICVLTFDRRDSPLANIFDDRTFAELNAHLDYLESRRAQRPGRDLPFRERVKSSSPGPICTASPAAR